MEPPPQPVFIRRLLGVVTAPIEWLRRLYHWVLGWADHPAGPAALGVVAFTEASFFPIPPDPLMWALCVGKRRRSFFFAAVCTVSSVLGGVLGWYIGAHFFDAVTWVIEALGLKAQWYGTSDAASFVVWKGHTYYSNGMFFEFKKSLDSWGILVLFVAALTPIPYKVATIASGVFGVPLWAVLLGSTLGRGLRYFAFGGLFFFFGDWARGFIERHFTIISILVAIAFVGGFVAIKYLV